MAPVLFRHGLPLGDHAALTSFDRIGKRQRRCNTGRIFAQAVASHHGGSCPPAGSATGATGRREAVNSRGLLRQVLFRSSAGPSMTRVKQVAAQHLARLGEGLFNHGVLLGEFGQHADALGALSRKAMANRVIIDSL